jgi:hypothetical protein
MGGPLQTEYEEREVRGVESKINKAIRGELKDNGITMGIIGCGTQHPPPSASHHHRNTL